MDVASDRLEKYIANGRKIVRSMLGIDFEEDVWQLPYNRAHLKNRKSLAWTGIPAGLTRLVKAMVANESLINGGAGHLGTKGFIVSMRWLGETVGDRDITTVNRKDLDLTARALIQRDPPFRVGSLGQIGTGLKAFVEKCNLHKLTEARIEWSNPFPRPEAGEREYLIKPEVFKAFGEIRAAVMAVDDNDQDRLLVHAITILICTGMRIGELMTLPEDCWHEGLGEDDEGRVLKGHWLGYAPEKRGLTVDTFPRWIPTALVPIVQESIEEIRRITGPARENARTLAEGRVNIPIDLNKSYDMYEIANLLGLSSHEDIWNNFCKLGIKTCKIGKRNAATGENIAEYIRHFCNLDSVMNSPFILPLQEALLVVPHLFFSRHAAGTDAGMAGTAKPMVQLQIQLALRTSGHSKSLFDRFGKVDPNTGEPYSFSTHDPRHTLTTWQLKHGLNNLEVAAYFGRNVESPERSNSFYDQMTPEEREALVDKALEDGRFEGGYADLLARIKSPVKREEVRHTLAANVGYSQLGICLCPEGGAPPTTPEACSSCPGLTVIPGSEPHQRRAMEVQADIEERVTAYEAQVADGVFMAGKWLEREYERQENHRHVMEVLFRRDPLKPGEEPTLVQMGKIMKNTKGVLK